MIDGSSIPRRAALALALFLAALAPAAACEMSFALLDSSGASTRILPGATATLEAGERYVLRVDFVEDHRNCDIPPEDTLFLLDDAKWKVGKADQGLVLGSAIAWVQDSRSANHVDIAFTAGSAGSYDLGVLRECPKGGYDETILFRVE